MRYVGLFMIFVCCTCGGIALSGSVTRSLSLGEGVLQFVRYARGQVSFFKLPVQSICASFQNETFQKLGFDKLICEKGLPVAIEEKKDQLNLSPETYTSLLEFAHRLGTLSYEEQIADCDYIAARLEGELIEKKAEIPAKRQIYSSMGLLSGAMAVLILL